MNIRQEIIKSHIKNLKYNGHVNALLEASKQKHINKIVRSTNAERWKKEIPLY